jgi:hypothetical protein
MWHRPGAVKYPLSKTLLLCAALLGLFGGCSKKEAEAPTPRPTGKAGNIELAKAKQYFVEFDRMCKAEGGKLWQHSLCGPFLLVDPASRQMVSNRQDPGKILAPRGGVFVGVLQANMSIANTSIEWQGSRWTMVIWQALDDPPAERLKLMGHEAFHRIEPDIGLVATGEVNEHLDTAEGRVWLQLEWNALQAALMSSGRARIDAASDALAFRAARRARFPEAASREIPLEVFEGLAEYSGEKLVGYVNGDVVQAALDRRREDTGLVRSFAYVSGPLYGYLLDSISTDWRRRVTKDTDLGALAGKLMRVTTLGNPETAAERYGGASLRAAEAEREQKRMAQIAEWRKVLVDGPVLIVPLMEGSGTFDPHKVYPIGDKQIVYTERELSQPWGKLTVTSGAILEDGTASKGYVSLDGAASDYLTGSGWKLQLGPGWTVAPGERSGDMVLVKNP